MANKSPKGSLRPTPQPQPIHRQHQQHSVNFQQFSGPVPHPDILARYDQILPGSAHTIIQMAMTQATHRQQLEVVAQNADIQARTQTITIEGRRINGMLKNELIATILGWSIAATCTAGAFWSMVTDKSWPVTVAFLSLPVASIVKALRPEQKNPQKK